MHLLTDLVETGVSDNIFPGAVLLCAKGNDILYHRAFGLANRYENRPMQKNSIFDLASLTKPMATTAALMHLADQGLIAFGQTLGSLLPAFQGTDKSAITVDMLLRHTAGLPAYVEYYKSLVRHPHNRMHRLTQMLVHEPLVQKPGTAQNYSDLGFMILGRIIETLSGLPIDRYVAAKIYPALGIENLFYIPLVQKDKIVEGYPDLIVSTQHCPWRKKVLTGEVDDDNTWVVGGVDGHAGLFGDAHAVFLFCLEILHALTGYPTRLLNPDVVKAACRRKDGFDMVAGFDRPSDTRSSAGRLFSRASVGHLGFTGTSFWIEPESGLICIFLTNRVHPERSNETIKGFRPVLHDMVHQAFSA